MIWHWSTFDALTPRQIHDLMRLRSEVFVVEQDCVYLDLDGRDPTAYHLLASEDGALSGYLRGFGPDGAGPASLGRVVVAPAARGSGLGAELMRQGMARLWEAEGPCPIHLSAQAHLADFYGRLGFVVCGAGYDEDGIPHLPMDHPGPGAG